MNFLKNNELALGKILDNINKILVSINFLCAPLIFKGFLKIFNVKIDLNFKQYIFCLLFMFFIFYIFVYFNKLAKKFWS